MRVINRFSSITYFAFVLSTYNFKGAAFNYVKDLLDKVAEKGWNAMPDLYIKIGYSKENGFFNFGTTYEV